MSTIESHSGAGVAGHRKVNSLRDPEFRQRYIDRMARAVLQWFPDMAEDVEVLVTAPPIDEWSLSNGRGLYGGDQSLIYRGIIANDLRATSDEMLEALDRARQALQEQHSAAAG